MGLCLIHASLGEIRPAVDFPAPWRRTGVCRPCPGRRSLQRSRAGRRCPGRLFTAADSWSGAGALGWPIRPDVAGAHMRSIRLDRPASRFPAPARGLQVGLPARRPGFLLRRHLPRGYHYIRGVDVPGVEKTTIIRRFPIAVSSSFPSCPGRYLWRENRCSAPSRRRRRRSRVPDFGFALGCRSCKI